MEKRYQDQEAPIETAEAAAGNEPVASWYRRHVKAIYAYLYRRTGNRADAEDLTEQVFLEALEKRDRYQEQGKVRGWLFTIARSRLVDHYRRHRDVAPLDQAENAPHDGPGPEAVTTHREQMDRIHVLVQELDSDQRDLLLLRFGGELTYAEIGRIVGKSEAAAKMAVRRLLDQLRARWRVATQEDDHE